MDRSINKIVKELKTRISDKYELQELKIFGSTASGHRRADSDIDVFVRLPLVNRQIEEELFDIAYDLELENDCLIDLIVLSDDALKGKYADTPIYRKISAEGVHV